MLPSEILEQNAKQFAEIKINEIDFESTELKDIVLKKIIDAYIISAIRNQREHVENLMFSSLKLTENEPEEEYVFNKIKIFRGRANSIEKRINDFFEDLESRYVLNIKSISQTVSGEDSGGEDILTISVLYTTD